MPRRSSRIRNHQRSVRYVVGFFLPLAVAAVLSAAGEPLMQAAMARAPRAMVSLAAFPVCTSVLFLAATPLWNVQQLVIAQAQDRRSYGALRRFVLMLGLAWTVAMLLLGWTPLAGWVFGGLIGVSGEVQALSISGFRWLAAAPLLFALRSLYYGVLIGQNATRPIRTAAIVRLVVLVLALVLGAAVPSYSGLLIVLWAMLIASAAELICLRGYVVRLFLRE